MFYKPNKSSIVRQNDQLILKMIQICKLEAQSISYNRDQDE